ncbi:unnamed protein product (macronuclear) [Paramecium tetraurelia]|uniref:Uncharacterized protein n=1 Tax=Paramecium tetraurelia TaxID=5888 RepID=A0E0Q8_PARTE|nr:uncharacterized protein GSPATT00022043001 [Paramecium tetraurelia]CAK88875.1 unnamed protein product [Paramecium tetraurelia]|eukprot:XP_001456272.1 hypothetical protein (macronuclear) [Paramecium tetraurelia strain d4-2]
MNDKHEAFFFAQTQKRRIHQQNYALKVVSRTKVDKETIQLSESLFNAKITAKQSSCIIRNIQRSIQQKIKFYDEQLRSSDSFKKQANTKSLSPDTIKPKCIENQEQSQNQQISSQQILIQPNPIKNNEQQTQTQTPIKNFNETQQSQKSMKQYTQSISPAKKQPYNYERMRTQNYSSSKINHKSSSYYLQQNERQRCYSKQKVKEQQKEQENNQSIHRAQTARVTAIAERNEEWKQKLQNKIDIQQKKQQQKEMVDCTFKPRINNQRSSKKYQQSVSKEFQTEINELMHLIHDQNRVKSKQ